MTEVKLCDEAGDVVATLDTDPPHRPPSVADGTVAQGLIDGLTALADEYGIAGVVATVNEMWGSDARPADLIPFIDLGEFQAAGYLMELNRQFLHPLGLAMSVERQDDGTVTFAGIWDYRSDPEGMLFADLSDDDARTKAASVEAERQSHILARVALVGSVIQPIGSTVPPET
jgi:hypothetical protein